MKTLIQRLTIPFMILVAINLIGFVFYKNYDGAVAGSLIGMIVAFLALEIRAKYD